jgi:hypothetical protein
MSTTKTQSVQTKIAQMYHVSEEQAQRVIDYIDENLGLDWSEASWRKIAMTARDAIEMMGVK